MTMLDAMGGSLLPKETFSGTLSATFDTRSVKVLDEGGVANSLSSVVNISDGAYLRYEADALALSDSVAPTVIRFTPADGSSGAATNSNIVLTFSEEVKRGSGNIVLKDAAGKVVEAFSAASNRLAISGNKLTINPTLDLAANTQYFVSFEAGSVKDVAGNSYAGSTTYDFRTGADTVAPTVIRFTPADGLTGVATNSNIVLTFSEAIKRGSGNIVLKDGGGRIVERFSAETSSRISISNNLLTLKPTNNLAANTQYFVTFEAGTVRDAASNAYAGTSTYDFRTGTGSGTSTPPPPPAGDTTAPAVVGFSPANGSSSAAIGANITFSFNEAIQRGSGLIVLRDETNAIVESFDAASSQRISISNNMLTIDPVASLLNAKRYTVSMAAGVVKDLAGNNFAGSNNYAFDTAPSPFNIDLAYTGDASFRPYFEQARDFWQRVIVGDLPDANGIDDLRISITVEPIDGQYGALAQAGPTALRVGSSIPLQGTMRFDSSDMAGMVQNGTLLRVVMHEMAHVFGFGTIWSQLQLNTVAGQYSGANGLAAYREMSGNSNAMYVPLELGGGAGTYNVHWSEGVFDRELMTGYSESTAAMPVSRLTVAALADLGYQVNYSAAESYAIPASAGYSSISLMA
jgi:methionine-rich copper-binding protein CopC